MHSFCSEFLIGNTCVGAGHRAFIIAEMSANHGQDYQRAVDIIHAAQEAGADAVKLQTYKPETLTFNCKSEHFLISEGLGLASIF